MYNNVIRSGSDGDIRLKSVKMSINHYQFMFNSTGTSDSYSRVVVHLTLTVSVTGH